jgi:BioD-like phosphotransacetylase family protein
VYPSPLVVSKAEKLNVPIMLVSTDTFSASKSFENLTAKIEAKDQEKISILQTLVKEHIDLSAVLEGEER